MSQLHNADVLVIGAGIMGSGIAQVAALADHTVYLHDSREGAAAAAHARLTTTLQSLVDKGKLPADAAGAALQRIVVTDTLQDAAGSGLVVEAIVEDLAAKRSLLQRLEGIVGPGCVLATNTSSISVTALAHGLQHPGRLVGMHFFNPVPLMRLVEVISGLYTEPAAADAVFGLAVAWGKVPVHARSTPGFIVNRIARPYYAEALALLLEQAASPAVIDACLRGAGFRMGPCELMDLIGHDTNLAVTQSVFDANFQDKRYQPSLLQQELVAAGWLGRKSGRGFYRYPGGAPALPAVDADAPDAARWIQAAREVTVHGADDVADHLEDAATRALQGHGFGPARLLDSGWTGLVIDGAQLIMGSGATAGELALQQRRADVAVFDRIVVLPAVATAGSTTAQRTALAYAVAPDAGPAFQAQAAAWLAALGFAPHLVADTPGLLVARTIAMLINEAADAVQQGVCDSAGADAAMKLGLNYPAGPFEWLARWSAAEVAALIDALDRHHRGERYRLSPWLRRLAPFRLTR